MDVKDATVLSERQTTEEPQPKHAARVASGSDQSHTARAAKDVVFGATAGIVGKYIEYPFDTVKVRLQSQSSNSAVNYSGPLDCFRQSIRRDGFWSLYRGISTPLFGAAVETGSVFFSYRLAQAAFRASTHPEPDPLPFNILLVCGAASGAFTSIVLTPIELIKCKIQVPSAAGEMRGALSLIAQVYQQDGIRGFFRGQVGTLIREMGGSAAWFGSYEGLSGAFRSLESNRGIAYDDPLPTHQQLIAGAGAGMAYNFMFFPADTIKSRMQTEDINLVSNGIKKDGFWAVGRSLWQSQGLKGLYRGCGITVARSGPSSAFIFTIYEALKHNFNK